ncbi:hypothetical protein H6F98_03575 [Microcoleus sp. FACHB-SPT15]|uniref:hypothetical protein n=1 Tax=Microcoleus sp. FACHB-SPT15 TaxID=2692830 RepID=UPI00177AFE07|nr:hypothetical protein [Microcoleus sp. FACHB-SPT15]MBD1804553.1 hypothetical protein [Microcoleus sp. FACHB-SPT15]
MRQQQTGMYWLSIHHNRNYGSSSRESWRSPSICPYISPFALTLALVGYCWRMVSLTLHSNEFTGFTRQAKQGDRQPKALIFR